MSPVSTRVVQTDKEMLAQRRESLSGKWKKESWTVVGGSLFKKKAIGSLAWPVCRVIPFTGDKSREEFREGESSRGRAYVITSNAIHSILRRFIGRGRKPRKRRSSGTLGRKRKPPYSPARRRYLGESPCRM